MRDILYCTSYICAATCNNIAHKSVIFEECMLSKLDNDLRNLRYIYIYIVFFNHNFSYSSIAFGNGINKSAISQ